MSIVDELSAEESLVFAINEVISIEPYDRSWPLKFASERERLLSLFPERTSVIEHVGSTAVPGLSAKPLLDIMFAVGSMEEADVLLKPLCESGYTTSEEFNKTLIDRRWLMRHANGRRTHHLHLLLQDGQDWREKICFRDLLRGSNTLAAEYEELKRGLAKSHGADREAYTEAKSDFIRRALGASIRN